MKEIEDLESCVFRNDAEGFLREYLGLLITRSSLSIPTGKTIPQVKLQFQECLPTSLGDIPDFFLDHLARRWLDVIHRLGRDFHEGYPKEALNYINNTKSFNKPLSSIVQVGDHVVKQGGNPKLNKVVPTLSDRYLEEVEASKKNEEGSKDTDV